MTTAAAGTPDYHYSRAFAQAPSPVPSNLMSDNNNDGFAAPAPRKPASTAIASTTSDQKSAQSSSSSSSSASTASRASDAPPPLPYTKPNWGGVAQYDYGFEVLKGGVSIDRFQGPRKDLLTIGKLCDLNFALHRYLTWKI